MPALRERGHEVHQMVRYRSGRWDGYDPHNLHFADLRDRDSITEAMVRVNPQVVVHLAAISAVSFSFTNPVEVSDVNYVGTINLWKAAAAQGSLEHFIHASTSEVYGSQMTCPIGEGAVLCGLSPYAVSKIAAEEFLRMEISLHKAPITVMRPFNSYGRALVDNRHFVVERAIVGALQDGRVHLHDPRPRRDFMFRDDHVAGYVAVVEKRPLREVINLSTGRCWSIAEMAEVVAGTVTQQTGREVSVDFLQVPDRPLDMDILHGDNTRAGELLGWYPKYSLEAGIAQAVKEWRQRLSL